MRFKYTAFTAKGLLVKDVAIAPNKAVVEKRLQSRGYVVEKISADRVGALMEVLRSSVSGVSHKDKIVLTRNLAVMVKSGLTLDESLSILSEQSPSPRLGRILSKINERIQAGKTLSESMAEFPRIFDRLYVSIISAAERSGSLEQSLRYLADQQNQAYEIRVKIRNALFYPAVVITATFTVMLLLSLFVLPKITQLFASFKTELPATTRAVIAISDFLTNNTLLVLIFVAFIVLILPFLLRSKSARPLTHRLLLRLPVSKLFTRYFNLALFCRTLGTLLVAGVPINNAIEICSETMRNVLYAKVLRDVAAVQKTGESLGALLRQHPHLFTPMVYRMIAVGEESGNLEEVLIFLADFHEREIDYTAKNLTNILEPLLLLTIGIAVALIAVSIISPIYQITGSFQFR